ncbi:MAG: ATP-binding protein [Holosporaceae bacterium]|jgi:anti-sigma regulatory factor (Ser/Thr protein kinase)|nr:ATP-binding protein [Holosporaceae bacterium]
MLLKIKNSISEIGRICDSVKRFCFKNDISTKKCHDITLILDEIVTNIIKYAYTDKKEHQITLSIQKKKECVSIKLTDDGIHFDPLSQITPDVTSSIEKRQIGGLGIFIAKQLSDAIAYSRINEKNQLQIIVSINKEKDHGD